MVNQLPQGWKKEELGKHYEILRGGSPRPIQNYITDSADGINWIKIGDVDVESKYIEKTKEKIKKEGLKKTRTVNVGDIILSNSMSYGRPYILKISGAIHDGWIVLRSVDNSIKNDLLYYSLLTGSVKNQFEAAAAGGVVKNLNIAKVSKTLITYPTDKDEQDYIVKTLDAVAEMIKLRKETIQLTKDLIPAIFQEMFGDCSENVLIGNNDYFEIEDGDRGNNYPKKEELLEKGDCLFLSAKNVTEDGFVFKENVFISQDKDKKLRTGKLKRYDFVMMTRGTIGNIAYYSPDIPYDNIRINSGMVIIRIKQGFEPLYFLQAMRSDNIKFQINNLITGAAVPQLPIHLIKKISLKLADNTKQKEFADKLEQINQNLEVQQKDLERLQELFDQLLQKAFTGELTRGDAYGKH